MGLLKPAHKMPGVGISATEDYSFFNRTHIGLAICKREHLLFSRGKIIHLYLMKFLFLDNQKSRNLFFF